MAKAIDPNSVRQLVIEVMYESDRPLSGSEIVKGLIEKGVDKKKTHIHSHLQTFKGMATPKVIHEEGKYRLTTAAINQYEETRGIAVPEELVEV